MYDITHVAWRMRVATELEAVTQQYTQVHSIEAAPALLGACPAQSAAVTCFQQARSLHTTACRLRASAATECMSVDRCQVDVSVVAAGLRLTGAVCCVSAGAS